MYEGINLSTYFKRGVDYVNLLDHTMTTAPANKDGNGFTHPQFGKFPSLISYICFVVFSYKEIFREKNSFKFGAKLNRRSHMLESYKITEDRIPQAKLDIQTGVILWVEQNEAVQDMLKGLPRQTVVLFFTLSKEIDFLEIVPQWQGNTVLDIIELLRLNLNNHGKVIPSSNEFIGNGKIWEICPSN